MTELWEHSASDIADLVNSRQASTAEVLTAFVARTEEVDDRIAAWCTLDVDGARRQAGAVQARVDAGESLPLAGVVVGVKDLLDTAGLRTTYGSRAYANHVPEHDDIAVARLRGAGAVVLGKTTTSEFGYAALGHGNLFPPVRNPWDVELTPGGSSAGSGAAVASGTAALTLGSDGGGSVRIPAALCGLVGVKASMGRVPCWPSTKDDRLPGASSWESLEHIGPLTRTVEDAAVALRVMAGPDPRDRMSLPGGLALPADGAAERLRGVRIGFSPDLGYAVVEPALVQSALASATALAEELESELIVVTDVLDDPSTMFGAVIARDTDLAGMRALAAAWGDELAPYVRSFLDRPWSAEQLTSAGTARQRVARQMASVMADVDLLLTPTSCVGAFGALDEGPVQVAGQPVPPGAWISLCWPANLTGLPAASVPACPVGGMPCGVQVIAGHLQDERLIDACRVLEAVTPWAGRWAPC